MLKKLLIMLIVLTTALLFGCATDPTEDPTDVGTEPQETELVNIVVTAEPSSMDWQSLTSAATQVVAIQIYETLYAIDRNYTAVPMLAADYPELSEDQLTYTITLREGVKFHNGKEMTADDVVASLERWGKLAFSGKHMFQYLDSIEKVNDYEIKIHLTDVYGPFVNALATPIQAAAIMPKEVVDQVGTSLIEDDNLVIGTGPYMLAEWDRGKFTLLERFDDYAVLDRDDGGLAGEKIAYTRQVKIHYASDPSVRVNGLITGMYDYARELPGEQMASLEAEGFKMEIVKPFYSRWLILNPTKPPFDDIKMRLAVAHALDVESIMLAVAGEPLMYEIDGAIYHPEHEALYTAAGTENYNVYDPERAKELLVEAGYNNEPIVFMTTRTFDWQVKAAEVALQNFKDIGLNIQQDVMEWSTLLEHMRDPEYWDMWQCAFGAGYLEPNTQLYLTGTWPFDGWYAKDDAMAGLLSDWREAIGEEERTRLMAEIQEQFYQDQPVVKYGNHHILEGLDTRLNITVEFYHPTYWNMWLALEKDE